MLCYTGGGLAECLLWQTLGLGLGLALEKPGLSLGLRYQGLGLDTNGLISITDSNPFTNI